MYYIKAELLYISIMMLPTSAAPTIICYIITRRHFKNNWSSEKVRKMQCKLSLGLLLQVGGLSNFSLHSLDLASSTLFLLPLALITRY